MNTSSPLVSKKSLALSALAAVGACAACCAVPVLVAVGVGGALTSAFAAFMRPGIDLALAAVAVLTVAGFTAFRARARRVTACATACEVGGGCGCGRTSGGTILSTPSPRPDEPIVCTADINDKPTVQGQLDGYRAAFRDLLRTETFEGGVRWVFAAHPGLANDLKQLAQKEHQCCAFFMFDLRIVGDTIIWETRANADAVEVLVEFARLPERLAAHPRGAEVLPIKRAIEGKGLIFAADAAASK